MIQLCDTVILLCILVIVGLILVILDLLRIQTCVPDVIDAIEDPEGLEMLTALVASGANINLPTEVRLSFIFFVRVYHLDQLLISAACICDKKTTLFFQTTTVQHGLRYWLLTLQVARTGGK